jgi:REP element-mobilizing transposase RayT
MPHSYVCDLTHCIFGIREQSLEIDPVIELSLWPYIVRTAHQNDFESLAVGGTFDHIHLLLSLPSNINVAKAVQLIKDSSELWLQENVPASGRFGWQEGYGAFSVSPSDLRSTMAYILGQKEHHRRKTFRDEFTELLEKNGVVYDPRYLFR